MTEQYQNQNDLFPQNMTEFTANFQFNPDDIRLLMGIGPTHNTNGYDVTYVYLIQKRRHKKNRINKKWLKRYGVSEKFITLKGCEVVRNKDDIEFTVKGAKDMDIKGG